VRPQAQHAPGGQDRHAHGLLTALLVPTDVGLAHAQARLPLPVQALACPTLVVDAPAGARRQLGQSGHQDLCRCGAQVSPSCAQEPSAFPALTPPPTRRKRPQGLAAVPRLCSGPPCAVVRRLRPRGHQGFARLLCRRFPGAGERTDTAPPAGRIGLVAVLDQAPVGLGALGRRAAHDHPFAQRRGTNAPTLARNTAFSLRSSAWRLGRMRRQPTGLRSPSHAASRRTKRKPKNQGWCWLRRPCCPLGCLGPRWSA